MRFFIEATDLRSLQPNKHRRVVEALSLEAERAGGSTVEISVNGDIMAAEPKMRGQLTRSKSSLFHPPPSNDRLGPLMLLAAYLVSKLRPNALTDKTKHELTWNLAHCLEKFSEAWQGRLGRFLEVESHPERRECFYRWLGERGFDFAAPASAAGDSVPASPIGAGDALVLAGASWRHDIAALNRRKTRQGFRLICLVYDLLPIDYPSFLRASHRSLYKTFLCEVGAAADVILTPSRAVADRMQTFLSENGIRPNRIAPICLASAVLSEPAGAMSDRLLALRLAERPFLLCVSELRDRKHVLWLYALCAKLKRQDPNFPMLAIAGKAVHMRIFRSLSEDPSWGRAGVFIEDPSDAELAWLYRNAGLFLQPGFEGGAGFALMEAIGYGCPSIAADAHSLVEASRGSAEHLPRDEARWANAIERVLTTTERTANSFRPPALLPQIAKALESDAVLNKETARAAAV